MPAARGVTAPVGMSASLLVTAAAAAAVKVKTATVGGRQQKQYHGAQLVFYRSYKDLMTLKGLNWVKLIA